MASSDKNESMMKQAQHIWSMLDDMAANDPEAYRKFIDKQLKEGRDTMKPPDAHMCVQTQILHNSQEKETLFINIMDWSRIPAPKTDEDPIPTMGGTIFKTTDESNKACCVVPVAFNTQVLKEYGVHSSLLEERRLLVNLAIDYVEDQNKVKLSRSFTILPISIRCKGPLEKSQSNLLKKLSGRDKEFENELGELEKSFGPLAAGCKDSLLQQLSSLTSSEGGCDGFPDLNTGVASHAPEIRLPGDHSSVKPPGPGAKLIEEIVSTETRRCKPEYEMSITAKEDGLPRWLTVKIQLPGVISVRECCLEVSDDDMYLSVPDRYELSLTFPSRTLSSKNHSAKFSKRTSCLLLTLPVADA